MKNLPFTLFLFTSTTLFGQVVHDGLEFSRTEFNFPKQDNWVSRIDTIEVRNLTNKTIHLLKQKDPRGFELRYPARGIDPGKTEFIEVIFSPKETGKFNFSFPVFHSASKTPATITYKGEIRSFDEFAETACPSFIKPNLKPVGFELEVIVLDSATQKPLGNSFIEISIGEYFSQHKTDASGTFRKQAGINYYFVLAEHHGYASRSVARHINPKNRKITLELPSLLPSQAIPPVVPTPTVAVTEPMVFPPTITTTSSFSLSEYKKNNIVFLIDKSSSMNQPDCLPLLQAAMIQLVQMARSEDRITIITYANEARVILAGTPGNEKEKIIAVINGLKCGGRTEGGKAITIAYKNAEENFIKGGMNQIILATDGGFNGISDNEAELMQLVGAKAKEEIKLSVLAFGQNRYGKAHITRLAKQGGGFYEFIANDEDAKLKLNQTIKLQSKLQ